ncbi:MAG: glycosyltransferase [Bacilli bacterium]|nr:glycosyltransferase [Bacilli bacterium]
MKLSVLIPVRNQTEKLIRNLKNEIIPYFDSCGCTYDILICSDHSSEEQQKMLEEAAKDLPMQVKLLPYEDIAGKGWGVKKSILAADGDYVLFFDADLSTDLHAFDMIKPDLGKYDAFIASRDAKGANITEKQTFIRRITHWGAKTLIKNKFHLKGITDTQCGYKMFRTSVAKKMAEKQIIMGFAFDVEYVYFLSLNGFSIKEIPVSWENDPDSSVSTGSTIKKFYKDLSIIKKNKKNYILTKEEKEALC